MTHADRWALDREEVVSVVKSRGRSHVVQVTAGLRYPMSRAYVAVLLRDCEELGELSSRMGVCKEQSKKRVRYYSVPN